MIDGLATTTLVVQRPVEVVDRSVDSPAARPSRRWELDALRVAAIAGVLAIHIFGMLVVNEDWAGTRRWWAAVAIDMGSIWVVPVFVMISGALVLAPSAHAAGPVAFYRKRLVRILPALVVWHLVYLIVVRVGLREERPSLTKVAVLFMDAQVYTALYFLWLIAGLYVIAPVLAAFLRDGGRTRALIMAGTALSWTLLVFVIAGASTLLGARRPITLDAWNQWWPYVGYFIAGWALHRFVLGRKGMSLVALVAAAALAEIVWQYGHLHQYAALQQLLPVARWGSVVAVASICVFLLAVGIGDRLTPGPRMVRALKVLSDASFGVFLVHLLIFEVVRRAVPVTARDSSLAVLAAVYVVVLASSFAISIAASKVPYLRAIV